MNSQSASAEGREFDFWGAHKSIRRELGAHPHFDQGSFDMCSSPSWDANTEKNINYESFPLLPLNYDCNNISHCSVRQQAIAESRRELMEMIHDMPESCYELSLKDIVDLHHGLQKVASEDIVIQDSSRFRLDTKAQTRKGKKKKSKFNSGGGKLSRIGSMEKEAFLIKMFFPISSLGSRLKKSKAVNLSKVSSQSSKQSDQDRWITRFVVAGLNKSIFTKSIIRRSSTSNASSSSRY